MPLTFGEIKALCSPYAGRAGKCSSATEINSFARQVMEYLLVSGSHAGVRKICLYAEKGCVSLPPEVETPIKIKINDCAGNLWNKWYSFHSGDDDLGTCPPIGQILIDEGVESPLAYAIPEGGSAVGVMATCCENEHATVLVQGKDTTGRPVFTAFNGRQEPGEKFRLAKEQIRYGQVVWGEITGVLKPRTVGYVSLFAVNSRGGHPRFLADWSPTEQKPMYRRYKIVSRDCPPIAKVTMLCRVRLKDSYHENDITFFDNSLAITLASQRLQSEVNNDAQMANYKRGAVEDILEKEAGYKRVPSGPVDVYFPLSGGAIKNIV